MRGSAHGTARETPAGVDWGVAAAAPVVPARSAAGAAAAPAGAGVVLAVLLGPGAGIAAAVASTVATAVWFRAQGRRALRAADAAPLLPGSAPRLENIARGLAADLGVTVPPLWLLPDGGVNALVCRSGVALPRAALDSLTRTELEAVVAHCLIRLRRSALIRAELASALGRSSLLGPVVTSADDVRAAALTRYPPALASALAKSDAERRSGPFWLAAAGRWHEHLGDRLAALADL
jgi:hypothetical protein